MSQSELRGLWKSSQMGRMCEWQGAPKIGNVPSVPRFPRFASDALHRRQCPLTDLEESRVFLLDCSEEIREGKSPPDVVVHRTPLSPVPSSQYFPRRYKTLNRAGWPSVTAFFRGLLGVLIH